MNACTAWRNNRRNRLRGVNYLADANGQRVGVSGAGARPDALKNILFMENTLDQVKTGFELAGGAQGVILKGNKILRTAVPFSGAGEAAALKLGENGPAGEGCGWDDPRAMVCDFGAET